MDRTHRARADMSAQFISMGAERRRKPVIPRHSMGKNTSGQSLARSVVVAWPWLGSGAWTQMGAALLHGDERQDP